MSVLITILITLIVLISFRYAKRLWTVSFVLLSKCWLAIILILLASGMFFGTSQGMDVVTQTSQEAFGAHSIWILATLWVWSYNSWLISRTIIDLMGTRNLLKQRDREALLVSHWVPIFIGSIPIFLLLYIFGILAQQINILLLLLIFFELYYYLLYMHTGREGRLHFGKFRLNRRYANILSLFSFPLFRLIAKFLNWLFRRKSRMRPKLKSEKYALREHLAASLSGARITYLLLHVAAFILLSVWPIYWSLKMGPFAVIQAAVSCYLMIALVVVYLRKRTRMPIALLLFISIFFFSAVNDNNDVGVIGSNRDDSRPELEDYFREWVDERKTNQYDTVEVILSASEGGGMRSAFWTYAVLRQLQLDRPDFRNNLFATSSVSGGSLGTALFVCELQETLSGDLRDAPILNSDNLSPMLSGLLFRELCQSILPFPVNSLDRSKISDEAWELNWQESHPHSEIMTGHCADFVKAYPELPVMLINAIHIESGQKAIFSPLKFDETKLMSIDLFRQIISKVKLSTAIGISSRFPFIQPPALLRSETGETWGHLADGGYYENSGVATAYQVYLTLRKVADDMVDSGQIACVNFSILGITNGIYPVDPASGTIPELSAPMKTLLNSWYTKGLSYSQIAGQSMQFISPGDGYFEIRLQRDGLPLPVGWYLSDQSKGEIIRQAERLSDNEDYLKFLQSF